MLTANELNIAHAIREGLDQSIESFGSEEARSIPITMAGRVIAQRVANTLGLIVNKADREEFLKACSPTG